MAGGSRQSGRVDQVLRQRLVGAAVLAAIGVIVLPLLLDDSERGNVVITQTNIPPRPADAFSSRIVPLDTHSPAPPVVQDDATTTAAAAAPVPAQPPPAAVAAGEQTPQVTPAAGTAAADARGQVAPRVGVSAWVVQLGSFAAQANAEGLEKRLKDSGYSAFVEKVVADDGQTVYRVRVGPELLRADAKALRDRLEGEINVKGIVVRYP
ncbi:MAG: SPOR domain-containing protein [Gammaproteobacteria bacterium]|nr:SPOR domain-containing protein [Gammaproteobacteria bacterium]